MATPSTRSLGELNHTAFFSPQDGAPAPVTAITQTPDGFLWVGSESGLYRFDGVRFKQAWADELPALPIARLAVDPAGDLWVGFSGGQASRIHAGQVTHFADAASLPPRHPLPAPTAAAPRLVDATGALWTTANEGLARYPQEPSGTDSRAKERFDPSTGLTGPFVYAFFEDREGDIWVGTNHGIDRFRPNRLNRVFRPGQVSQPALAAGADGDVWVGSGWAPVYRVAGNPEVVGGLQHGVSAMVWDPAGVLWVAGQQGVQAMQGTRIRPIALPAELTTDDVRFQAMSKGPDGALWLSASVLGLYRFKDGRWSRGDAGLGLPTDWGPLSMTQGPAGALWLGYPRERVVRVLHGRPTFFNRASGLDVGGVLAIAVRGEHVWIAGNRGVQSLAGDRFISLAGWGGERFRSTSGVVETASGDLWLNSIFGLYHVPADELRTRERDPSHPVKFERFTSLDGMEGQPQQLRPIPTLVEDTKGRIWASTNDGVIWLDPNRIERSTLAPPPVVESIAARGRLYANTGEIHLPAHTTALRVDYTVPLLSIPERVHFRYRLEGVDDHWQEAGNRRQAFYTNLAPGTYSFRVMAGNEDGVWSPPASPVVIHVSAAFVQTPWFRLVVAALAGIALWMAWLARVRRIHAHARVQQEERERIARDVHDTLLQSLQALILQIHVASSRETDPQVRRKMLDAAVDNAQAALIEGRDKIMELRADDEGSLSLARRFVDLQAETGYAGSYDVAVQGESRPLTAEGMDALYAMGREMILNAVRHANAGSIRVLVAYGRRHIAVRVRDNGKGIDTDILKGAMRVGHWGLRGIRERATALGGTFTLRMRLDGGTEAEAKVRSRLVCLRRK